MTDTRFKSSSINQEDVKDYEWTICVQINQHSKFLQSNVTRLHQPREIKKKNIYIYILHGLVQFQAWNTVIKIWNLIWHHCQFEFELAASSPKFQMCVSPHSTQTLKKMGTHSSVHVVAQDFFYYCTKSTVDWRVKLIFMIWMTSSTPGGAIVAAVQQDGLMSDSSRTATWEGTLQTGAWNLRKSTTLAWNSKNSHFMTLWQLCRQTS